MSIVWKPKAPESTQMGQFMQFVADKHARNIHDYSSLHQWSITYPDLFWEDLCDFFHITFPQAPTTIFKPTQSMLDARWFQDAGFNFAEKLLSKNDNSPALISIDEMGRRRVFTYEQLRQAVSTCARSLQQAGIQAGDRVAGLMPNIAETIIAMLATAAIGAIWSSCSSDFGAAAALDRLGQIEPKILFAADGHQYAGKSHDGLEKIQELATAMPSLQQIIIIPYLNAKPSLDHIPNAILWDSFLNLQSSAASVIPFNFQNFPFDHPLYILFSSGTTGKPKCIVHGAGGTLLQHIKELGLHCDINNEDKLFFYTSCGWMMWNWMISVLALGATLVLYEGSSTYPDATRLLQLVADEKITVFGTSAKFISVLDKSGLALNNTYDLSQLRLILSTGSPLLPQQYDFIYESIKNDVQLASISGGTDIVSCFALGNPTGPVYRGELQCLGLGMAVAVFNEKGEAVTAERGELVCTQAFPSMPLYFWNDPEKKSYHKAYFERFPGIWAHGDFAELTEHQGLIIYGRSDAILNPGGVRIGTAEIYRQIEKFPEILDSVVIGQDWEDDVRIVLFVKLQSGHPLDEDLQQRIRQCIKHNASPKHIPTIILETPDIPRTISGKTVELAVRQVVHGHPVNNVQSLANPEALEYFRNRPELQR